MTRVGIFLVVTALLVGTLSYAPTPTRYTLTIASSVGGKVVTPGEASFTYDAGTKVDLVAEADDGYQFVNWSASSDSLPPPIADLRALGTSIVLNGNYYISANFAVPILIRDWYDLNAIRDGLGGVYILMNHLNCTTPGYEELAGPTANGGEGWRPIGADVTEFTGRFDGGGYDISGLFINRPSEHDVGLFATVGLGGAIENIGVVNASVKGMEYVGGLIGVNIGNVANAYSISSLNGTFCVGGLVGSNSDSGTITNSYSGGNVTGHDDGYVLCFHVGGLVGNNVGTLSSCHSTASVVSDGENVGGLVGDNAGPVTDCYSGGSATGSNAIGGLIGRNENSVSLSYATGSVTGGYAVGGFIGRNGDRVSQCYSTGSVTGNQYIGGLVGENFGHVTNCYSAGSATGDQDVGGLVGDNSEFIWLGLGASGIVAGTITNCYSTGSVTGNQDIGGLVGSNHSHASVTNSFWDTRASGQAASAGGARKTALQMQAFTTFSGAGWDIITVAANQTSPARIWNIVDGVTYPFLSWQS